MYILIAIRAQSAPQVEIGKMQTKTRFEFQSKIYTPYSIILLIIRLSDCAPKRGHCDEIRSYILLVLLCNKTRQ